MDGKSLRRLRAVTLIILLWVRIDHRRQGKNLKKKKKTYQMIQTVIGPGYAGLPTC